MKAIIIAAGRGRRMMHLTEDNPKCLLGFNGKSLLDIQLEALRANGIKDISIVVGYKKEKINYPGLKYYENGEYPNNNILHSLFYAEEEMNTDFIASYSDIIYTSDIITELIADKNDISIAVDTAWHDYYEGREDHPIEEAESVLFDTDNKVVRIGKKLEDKKDRCSEFLGLVKCSGNGVRIFREHFRKLKPEYQGRPFQEAPVFEKAYVTDMIQDLVDSGVPVHCITVKGGWMEIDTVGDYERALKIMRNTQHAIRNTKS